MKIIYLILAHKNLSHLERLVQKLNDSGVRFLIHMDKESSLKSVNRFPVLNSSNVKFLTKRFPINWGGFNMVRATLELMREAYSQRGKAYYVLLSGSDYPVKTNAEIRNYLSENYGLEFINYWSLPYQNWSTGGLNRVQQHWFVDNIGIDESRIIAKLQEEAGFIRNGIEAFQIFGGSQWWCLTEKCVSYILKFVKQNPAVSEYFSSTLIPDEMFFQSIVANSSFKQRLANENLRYLSFIGGACHPETVLPIDLDKVLNSGKLWARKFDHDKYPDLLDEIDEQLIIKDPKEEGACEIKNR